MIKVVIVDDETILRQGIAALVATDPNIEVIGEFSDALQALDFAKTHQIDIILLDIEMPKMNGIQAAVELRKTSLAKIILLTRHGRPGLLRRAIQAGASGYVTKISQGLDLVNIIKTVHRGDKYIDSNLAMLALSEKSCPLSDAQIEVLELLYKKLSIEEVSDKLFLAPGTVRNTITKINKTLNVADKEQAVDMAWREGWI